MFASKAERAMPPSCAPGATMQLIDEDRSVAPRAQAVLDALIGGLPLAGDDVRARAGELLHAAVLAGRSLDAEQAAHALGIACSLVSPTPGAHVLGEEDPWETAALAVRLARADVDAPSGAIEGRHGLLAVFGDSDPRGTVARVLRGEQPERGTPSPGAPRSDAPEAHAIPEANLTQLIARWTLEQRGPVPTEVASAARVLIGNTGALVLAAMGQPSLRRLRMEFSGEEAAVDAPDPEAVASAARDSALLYGIAAHLEDFDDTHLDSVVHLGPCVVPAALALCPSVRPSDVALGLAVALGAEVAIRLGLLLQSALRRGWHMSGLVAPIASAVTCGVLLGLDERRLALAVHIAASRASGLTESLGTLTKPVHLGHASRAGVTAALTARDASVTELPHDAVGAMLMALDADPGFDAGPGWRVHEVLIKPYACGVLGHTPIDLALALRGESDGRELDSLELAVSSLAMQAMGRASLSSALETKFSIRHAVAHAYIHGHADPAAFTDVAFADDGVRRLRERLVLHDAPELGRFAATVTARWRDGSCSFRRATSPRVLDVAAVESKAVRLLQSHGPGALGLVAALFGKDRSPAQLWADPRSLLLPLNPTRMEAFNVEGS